LPDFDERTPYFGVSKFTYDPETDSYGCPNGETLARKHAKYTEGVIVYQADAAACNACPLKAQCTESATGRMVHRSLYEEYLERVRGYHETPAFEKAMTKRQVWVEPLFAEAKQWHHLDKFRLRGRRKVNSASSPLFRVTTRRRGGFMRRAWRSIVNLRTREASPPVFTS
jgi:hypothetical protein